jgi:hypothetical protein
MSKTHSLQHLETYFRALRVQTIELVQYLNECRDKVVNYDIEVGARCPVFCCGHPKCRVVKTYPLETGVRFRKHKCTVCGMEFKSCEKLD